MRRLREVALASLIIVGTWLGSALPAAADKDSRHAHENSMFAMGQAGAVLLAIDVTKGTTTVIGPTGFPLSIALAITRTGKAAYTITNTPDKTKAQLAKIDLETGHATLVGKPLGQDLFIMGMTFSPDGVLYAAGDARRSSPTFNSLYTIDLHTGLATRVGSLGVSSPSCGAGPNCTARFVMSFSFGPDGRMYGATTSALYRIDRTTGAATKVVGFAGASMVMGITFDEDGKLYAADYIGLPAGSTIYTVDLRTGFFSPLLKTGIALVHNIAFRPEPGSRASRHSSGNDNGNDHGNL
jgi:DNA-binding beta-propeller fold protein YncE